MGIPSLDAGETECVKNCLFKFNSVERLMIEKMRQVMEGLISQDPNLKKAIMANGKEEGKTQEWFKICLLSLFQNLIAVKRNREYEE